MSQPDRSKLPIRWQPFAGVANTTLEGSQSDWEAIGHADAPAGAFAKRPIRFSSAPTATRSTRLPKPKPVGCSWWTHRSSAARLGIGIRSPNAHDIARRGDRGRAQGVAVAGPELLAEPGGPHRHDDGRPLLGRKLAGKSQREPRDLGPVVEDDNASSPVSEGVGTQRRGGRDG
jgi:hypothetical protein